MLRRLVLTGASVIALTATASAADMYVPGPAAGPGGYKDAPWAPTWAGFYVGVNGGYGWSDKVDQITLTDANGRSDKFGGPDRSGGFGGGQIGYNWQGVFHPHLVFGVEADIQGSGISDKLNSVGTYLPGAQISSNLDYFGTVRARLGYAFGPALVYATGGLAYGGVRQHVFYNDSNTITFGSDKMDTGYAAGGGIEYSLNPKWSLKGEYQFISLDSDHLTGVFNTGVGAHLSDINNDFHTVRVGINYHFAPAYEPLK